MIERCWSLSTDIANRCPAHWHPGRVQRWWPGCRWGGISEPHTRGEGIFEVTSYGQDRRGHQHSLPWERGIRLQRRLPGDVWGMLTVGGGCGALSYLCPSWRIPPDIAGLHPTRGIPISVRRERHATPPPQEPRHKPRSIYPAHWQPAACRHEDWVTIPGDDSQGQVGGGPTFPIRQVHGLGDQQKTLADRGAPLGFSPPFEMGFWKMNYNSLYR